MEPARRRRWGCWRSTGKGPAGAKRVDANARDKENPEHPCRLVAKEIQRDKREDLLAATPPLVAKKILLALAGVPGMSLEFIDVARAYFHARTRRRIYVELSREDHEGIVYGLLRKATCGTRDAAFARGAW
jgi:hypothetical protein